VGNYDRLTSHLLSLQKPTWRCSFKKLEGVLGFRLPATARSSRSWWLNARTNQGWSWSVAGWQITDVSLREQQVRFARLPVAPGERKPAKPSRRRVSRRGVHCVNCERTVRNETVLFCGPCDARLGKKTVLPRTGMPANAGLVNPYGQTLAHCPHTTLLVSGGQRGWCTSCGEQVPPERRAKVPSKE
jgi:hypothetical protein